MLTPREKDVLDYIIKFKEVNGYSPTIQEIKKGINTHSINHVQMMIGSLYDKEYISFKPKSPRTIRVLKFK